MNITKTRGRKPIAEGTMLLGASGNGGPYNSFKLGCYMDDQPSGELRNAYANLSRDEAMRLSNWLISTLSYKGED